MSDSLKEFFATQIDIRVTKDQLAVVRLDGTEDFVLYKDGLFRQTSDEEIHHQINQLVDWKLD